MARRRTGKRRRSRAKLPLRRIMRRMARHPYTLPALVLTAVTAILILVGCPSPGTVSRPQGLAPVFEPRAAAPLDATVRVRLCGRYGVESFQLGLNTSYVIEDIRTGNILEDAVKPSGARKVRRAPNSPSGILVGTQPFASNAIRVLPTYDAALVVDGKRYRGTLTVRRAGSQVVVTNELDIESYLRGVLRAELPASFHPECFAALAIAARTFVLYQKQEYGGERDFDVLPDERSQMYVGVSGESAVSDRAVALTRGEVCTSADAPRSGLICTYYSSCCGGMSQHVRNVKPADPPVRPLAGGVACQGCRSAPVYRWDPVRLSKAELTKRLVARFPSLERLGRIVKFEPISHTPDGRFIKIRLTGQNKLSEVLIGEDFRLAVGGRVLKSTRCQIEDDGDGVVFQGGRGYGHGLGLCQYGANAMAKAGHSHRDILARYYPGCEIRRIELDGEL